MKVIKTIKPDIVEKSVKRCRDRGIIIPTFAELRNPEKIPAQIKERLKEVGLWDINPLNLFRITWKNEPKEKGGLFNKGNFIEFPSSLTGVSAKIIGLVGKWFPTGAHKVGAGFGCLVPRLVSGEFDPDTQKAVWPSTGNFCRGGAFDCAILACKAIAILPEGMSKERFDWLKQIGTDEIIATPGTESNVKEIYDKCWELRRERGNEIAIFNQFEEFGNACWHYYITGSIVEEIFEGIKDSNSRLSAFVSATGSAGTIAAGDYLKERFPNIKVVAVEALQCPTLYQNGFGAHRIEGIGDKHVPWIHNVRNTDMVVAIDDEQTTSLMRLFNEEKGKDFLVKEGVESDFVEKLSFLGFSGICNLAAGIKVAKYYEMNSRDYIFIPLTDSIDLYKSRIKEYRLEQGEYTEIRAGKDFGRWLLGCEPDYIRELTYRDRKALHNLKYFTWVEQQGKTVDELNALWDMDFWKEIWAEIEEWDKLIKQFNQMVGLI